MQEVSLSVYENIYLAVLGFTSIFMNGTPGTLLKVDTSKITTYLDGKSRK